MFSWLPSPQLKETGLFPGELGEWVDENYNMRTAVPFVFLGVGLRALNSRLPFMKALLKVLLIAIVLVTLVELGQLFLPARHFDIRDILWAGAGAILGALIHELFCWLKTSTQIRTDRK
ncbi:VanZ family protein [Jiulongibacter sp. NS-SX5]|uniref:VanZ family protein n=1 Tax=Jiulongibacter sp. NS-SX5 TaxID=3463854 RepID=UPI00405946A9